MVDKPPFGELVAIVDPFLEKPPQPQRPNKNVVQGIPIVGAGPYVFSDAEQITTQKPHRRGPVNSDTQVGQWIGRRGTITDIDQSVGLITPAGLIWPNDYDAWDYNTTTDLSEVPDVTAAVQAAINFIESAGRGGTVLLPPGILRINGVTISGGGVRIEGSPWEDQSASGRGLRGTFILTDSTAASTITLAPTANLTLISNVGFIQVHEPDAVGWTPTVYPYTIANNSQGAAIFEKLLFWGCQKGVRLGDTGTCGDTTLRDCEFACYDVGAEANDMSGMMIMDALSYNASLLGSGRANQILYAEGNGDAIGCIAILVADAVRGVITNASIRPCLNGIVVGAATKTRLRISDCDFFGCTHAAIFEQGTSTTLRMSGITIEGAPVSTAIPTYGFFSTGIGPDIDLIDCYMTTFGGSAIVLGDAGNLRMGPNCWINNWNLFPGVTGLPNPAPAIAATIPGGTVTYSTITHFTIANGGPNTGGGGTFTTY